MDMPTVGNDFVGDRSRIKRISLAHNPGGSSQGRFPSETSDQADHNQPDKSDQRKIVNVSVADISAAADLAPLSFRILEAAAPGYLGELEPLIQRFGIRVENTVRKH